MNDFIDPDTQTQVDLVKAEGNLTDFVDPDSQQGSKAIKANTMSTAEAGLSGFNRPFEQIAEGGLQLGAQALGAVGVDTSNFQNRLAEVRKARESGLEQAREEHPIAAYAGQTAGVLGSAAALGAIPGGTTGGMLRRLGTGAVAGAGFGGAGYVEEGGSRLEQAGLGALFGAGVTGVAAGAGSIFRAMKNQIAPGSTKIAKDLAEGAAQQPEKLAATQEAAERLGTFVSPGEASGSSVVRQREGRLKFPEKQRAKMQALTEARNSGLTDKLQSTIDSMVPEGKEALGKEVFETYEALKPQKLNETVLGTLIEDDPIIARAAAAVEKDPSYRPDLYEATSLGRWDMVKRYLDDLADKQDTGSNQRLNIENAKNKLVSTLDKEIPEYADARAMSQRLILQREMEDKLAKVKLASGEAAPSISNITKSLFSNTKHIDEVRDAIRTAGGNTQQLEDVITVAKAIEGSSFEKALNNVAKGDSRLADYFSYATGAGLGAGIGGPAGAIAGAAVAKPVVNLLGNIPASSVGKAYIRLATDPQYAGEVARMTASKGANKTRVAAAAIAKVIASEGLLASETPRDERGLPALPVPEDTEDLKVAISSAPLIKGPSGTMSPQATQTAATVHNLVNTLPKQKGDAIYNLSQMSPEEYYKLLDTKEKKAAYFNMIKKHNGDQAAASRQLRQLSALEEQIKNVPKDEQDSFKKKLFAGIGMVLLGALLGGQLGAVAMLAGYSKSVGEQDKLKKATTEKNKKLREKLEKERNKALDDLIYLNVKTLRPIKKKASYY